MRKTSCLLPRLLIRNNSPLHNRSMIVLVSPHNVEKDTQHDSPAKHQNRPVHADKCDGDAGWEETEYDRDGQEAYREDVDGKAKLGAKFPWTPANLFVSKAFGGDQGNGNEVAAEKTSDGEGDDGVESNARSDIDQADDGG